MKSLTKPLIQLMIFLFPVFVVPVTAQVWEMNKMVLLILGTAIILAVYVVESLFLKRTLHITNTFLGWLTGLFLLTALLSLLLTRDWYYSLVGMSGNMAGSFLSLLALSILVGITVGTFSRRDVRRALGLFTLSTALMTVGFLASLVGPVRSIFGGRIPAGFSLATGNLQELGLFLAVMTLVAISYSVFVGKRLRSRLGYLIFGLLSLITVLVISYTPALYVLIFGFVGVFVVYFNRMAGNSVESNQSSGEAEQTKGGAGDSSFTLRNLSMAVSLLGIALITSFVFYQPFPGLNPSDVYVKTGESLSVTRQTWANYPLTGTGLQTVLFDWTSYRSENLNQTSLWNARFNSLGNEWFNVAVEGGVAMFLAWMLLTVGVVFFGVLTLVRKKLPFDGTLAALILGQLALILVSFITAFGALLWFTFFLFLALTTTLYADRGVFKGKSRTLNVNTLPGIYASVLGLGGVAAFIGMFIVLFAGANFYRADISYAQGLRASDRETQREHFQRAVNLNPYSVVYTQGLVQSRLAEAEEKVNELQGNGSSGNSNARQQTLQEVRTLLENAQSLVTRSTDLHSEDIRPYEMAGSFYLESLGYQVGFDETQITSVFETARELDPANPSHLNREAEYYLSKAQQIQARQQQQARSQGGGGATDSLSAEAQQALSTAEEKIAKALELKKDYARGYRTYASIYAVRGEQDKQIAKLEEYRDYAQQNNRVIDRETYFALGQAYFNAGDTEDARRVFTRLMEQFPKYVNAIYSLGLLEEQADNLGEARQYFEQAQKLVPESQKSAVQQKLDTLGQTNSSSNGGSSLDTEDIPSSQEESEGLQDSSSSGTTGSSGLSPSSGSDQETGNFGSQ